MIFCKCLINNEKKFLIYDFIEKEKLNDDVFRYFFFLYN